MPGVLQVEAMAQAGCILAYLKFEEESKGKRPAFMGVDACRFRRAVRPGDVLKIEAELEKFRHGIIVFNGKIFVDGEAAAEANLMARMV
jgi:3-hydroxymyristoyl/3-hydroxydecanoyl-(acyl carrier protein) dehydratase